MKYFFHLILALLTLGSCQRSQDERSKILKVYNWADYIDEDVLAEFPEWYKEQTGEDIEVIYQGFDINEVMLTKIERGHEDFDVVCPSEYIIDRIETDDEEMNAFLFSLGCYSGEPITVVSHIKGGCIVSIKDGRYNIDNELAQAIIVG